MLPSSSPSSPASASCSSSSPWPGPADGPGPGAPVAARLDAGPNARGDRAPAATLRAHPAAAGARACPASPSASPARRRSAGPRSGCSWPATRAICARIDFLGLKLVVAGLVGGGVFVLFGVLAGQPAHSASSARIALGGIGFIGAGVLAQPAHQEASEGHPAGRARTRSTCSRSRSGPACRSTARWPRSSRRPRPAGRRVPPRSRGDPGRQGAPRRAARRRAPAPTFRH